MHGVAVGQILLVSLRQVHGAVAARVQEGLEELSLVEGQEVSGRVAVRRYPSSKVRSSGCALLEQP